MPRSVPAFAEVVNAARQAYARCETRTGLKTPSEDHVHGITWWRRLAILPLSAFIRLWWRTIRVSLSDEDRRIVMLQGEPTLFLIWHNRLFLAAEIARRYRGGHPIHGLISASRDGAWLVALLSTLGMRAVRGSSSRRGREAITGMVEALAEGHDVCVTPDGPRGPCYGLKPGSLVVARRARARLVLAGFDFESSWRLRAWDGFHIPKPFSRVHMRFLVADPNEREDIDEAARELGRRLVELNPDRIQAPVKTRA
jgi:lysophospholipid acyltransferase (LPLAT)-like uncharacterized protein